MIVTTTVLTLAFVIACISIATHEWMVMEQTGKDPKIIFQRAEQGLFERCVHAKYRSRSISNNCYGLSDAYGGKKQADWEKAVTGMMVTATVVMAIAAFFSCCLMVSQTARTGVFSDIVPVIIGNIAAILAIIALAIYNSKFEELRTRLLGTSIPETHTESEVNFGYSFYIGWLSALTHFFVIFFFFIFRAWVKETEKNKRRTTSHSRYPRPI